MSTCDEILSTFFRSYFFRKAIKEKIKKTDAAIKIQRTFRRYLYFQLLYEQVRFQAALKIQRALKAYKEKCIKEKKHIFKNPIFSSITLPMASSTNIRAPRSKRRIFASLLPPYRNKNKNRLTPKDMEAMEEEQKENVKWVSKDIIGPQIKKIFNSLVKRDNLLVQNIRFADRYVSKTFFTFTSHTNEIDDNHIISSFIHVPTFTIYSVTKNHISRQMIDLGPEDVEEFYFNFKFPIIDSVMHKLSGRIFCLLSNWTITVFENGYFTTPREPEVPKPLFPQSKYLYVDKYGYLWMMNTHKHSTLYLLDPFCFSLISKYVIILPPRRSIIKSFFPIFFNGKLNSFFATSKSNSQFYVCDLKGSVITTFNSHIKCTPRFTVSKTHIITYGDDRKMFLYKRSFERLTELNSFNLSAIPNSVAFIHGLKLFVVASSDSTLCFYTMTNESFALTTPINQIAPEMQDVAYEVLGEPTTTQSRSLYSVVLTVRVLSMPMSVSAVQFAENAALVETHLKNGMVITFWLIKQTSNVKCCYFDTIKYPITVATPKMYAKLICEKLYSHLQEAIEKTRRQFRRDSTYLHQIGYELEKRYLASRFKAKDIRWASEVLFQSPFKRWTKSLSYLGKNTISVYELFYYMNELLVTKFKTVKEMNNYIISHIEKLKKEPVGISEQMIGTRFTIDELMEVLSLFIDSCSEDLNNYIDSQQKFNLKKLNFSTDMFKKTICTKNKKVIYRLIEIENIIKNRLYVNNTQRGFLASLKLPKYTLKIPVIVPENSLPPFNQKWMKKSKFLMPDPLVERFRYRSNRELEINEKDIVYCSYGTESPYAKVVPMNNTKIPLQEIRITRPMAKMSMTFDLIAISPDSSSYIVQYPVENTPMNYILASNPFRDARSSSILVARYWLSQILMMIAGLHEHNIVVRSLLPSNLFVSFDGINVQIQSLADALFDKEKSDKPLPFNEIVWNPPECFFKEKVTPSFDIFQFGVLMCYMLTGMTPNSFVNVLRTHQKLSLKSASDVLENENFLYDPFDGLPCEDFPFFVKKGRDLVTLIDVQSEFSLMEICRTCMDINPKKRPTAKQLLFHPFFNLGKILVKRARKSASAFVKRVPVPLLVDGIFYTLLNDVEEEMSVKDGIKSPSLSVAVNILNYFINPNDDFEMKIQFPIDTKVKNEIVEEVFNQHIFDKMVSFVIDHLHARSVDVLNIENDMPFLDIVSLYHKFFISCLNDPSIFVKCFDSFHFLVTGMSYRCDSYVLSNFLHKKLRPLAEFFFTKIPPKTSNEFKVSQFYCDHFLDFYDNNREFGEGLAEKSELRCSAVLDFYETFLDVYPCEDAIKLCKDFNVLHKIDVCLLFSRHQIIIQALSLSVKLLKSQFADKTIFDRYTSYLLPSILLNESNPYQEKVLALEITRLLLFSNSLIAISHLLMINIIDALVFCSKTRVDRSINSVWGKDDEERVSNIALNLLTDICQKGMNNMYKPFIFYSNDVFKSLYSLKIIDYQKIQSFKDEIMKSKKTQIISDSFRSIVHLAETSPMSTVLTMAQCTQSEFETGLEIISEYLHHSKQIEFDLFSSLLKVWNHHRIKPNRQLLERIKNDFKKRDQNSVQLVSFIFSTLLDIPDYFIDTVLQWIENVKFEYNEIRDMINKHTIPPAFINEYPDNRKSRTKMLSSILKTHDKKLTNLFSQQKSFLQFVLKDMLPDINKLNITTRLIPTRFEKYKHAFPIRSEALIFIHKIIKERARNVTLFYFFSNILKQKGVLEKEAELVMKVADPDFRRTSIRLLNILNEKDSPFQVISIVLKNTLLMNLKDEELNDWENFQLLRNAFAFGSKPPRIKRIRPLYDST